MGKQILTKYCIFIFLILVLISNSFAAISGNLKGSIKDSQTGEALPGANVFIKGTSFGAASNAEGDYILSKLPPGNYTLVVRYIGYEVKELSIQIQAGQTLNLDVELDFVVLEGEDIVITAQAEGQIEAINQQISSRTIESVVSDARIQELPDANAAESVGRLPGVSIIRSGGEGNTVAIRGLSPKYNVITINGIRVSSTAANNRTVNLNVVSPNVLGGISVIKSLTPDKDADAVGGVVDLKLKKAPKGLRTDLMLQGGYNGQQSSYDMFKTYANVSNRFLQNKLGVLAQVNYERANRGSDRLTANYELQGEKKPGEQYAPIYIGNFNTTDSKLIKNRIGGSLMLDYNLPNDGQINFSNFISHVENSSVLRADQYDIEDRGHSYSLSDNLSKTLLFSNALSVEHHTRWGNIDYGLAHSFSKTNTPDNRSWTFLEDAAFDDQSGSIDLSSLAPEQLPAYTRNNLDNTRLTRFSRNIRDINERNVIAQANIEIPYTISKKITGQLKIGGKYSYKSREFDREEYGWGAHAGYQEYRDAIYDAFPDLFKDVPKGSQSEISMKHFLDTGYDTGKFLDGQYELGYTPDLDLMNKVSDALEPLDWYEAANSLLDDYNGTENLSAGYIMSEINLTDKLMFLPGVRFEHTETEYSARFGEQGDTREFISNLKDTTSTRSNDYWFPMFHLRYQMTDWFDIRLARTRSLTRPDYNSFSPYRYINASHDTRRGNPELLPSISTNYDAYFSVYNNTVGLLSFGMFYKEIENLIWSKKWLVLDPIALGLPKAAQGGFITTFLNNENLATFKGFEIDWQTHFWYLPGLLRGIVLNVNYTHIASDTDYPYSLYKSEYLTEPPWFRETVIDTSREGRMPNQPNDIANVSLGYDIGGFSARLSFLFQGNTLSRKTIRSETDGFTEDYFRWDFSLKQSLPWEGLQLYFNVNNLSDRPDKSFQSTRNLVTAEEFYGLTADIGIRYRFQ